MAQQFVNGELVDDGQEDQTANPMAGLQSTATPSRQGGFTPQASAYETPDWQSKVNTMGLNPNWDTLKKAGQAYNINPEDWSKGFQYYNDNITPFAGNSQWWGQDAMTRAAMQGYAGANPNANFNWEQYTNPSQETSQQKFKADEQMALQNKGGDDLFGSLLPLLLVGGLGLATGGFGFGAAGAAGEGALAAGAGAGAAEAGIYGASGLGAGSAAWSAPSIAGGLAADNAIMSGFGSGVLGSGSSAGEWSGDFGGSGNFTPGQEFPNVPTDTPFGPGINDGVQGLLDLYGPQSAGYDPLADALTGRGPLGYEGGGANNLVDALNVPQPQTIPNVNVSGEGIPYSPDTVGPIDPAVQGSLDPAPIREAGVNASLKDQARLGLKGIQQMSNQITGNPWFQGGRLALNEFQKQRRYNDLRDLYSKMEQRSDVGAPFRDMMMRSYSDPNFFNNMPEFKAGGAAFDQQYRATAGQKGTRSQLGGAAHNIAVNRENARLADLYRGRLGQMAGIQPNMSGMAGIAPAMASAGAARGASLFDPQLWKAAQQIINPEPRIMNYSAGIDDSGMY